MDELQQYLGLVPRTLGIRKRMATPSPPSVVMTAAQRPTPADLIFIAIDIEAYEHDQSKITEIGIAMLDTRDMTDPPGSSTDAEPQSQTPLDASAWSPKIKARHLRIEEYSGLVNRRYIRGCADKFHFGRSEMVKLADVAIVMKKVFQHPLATSGAPSSATIDSVANGASGEKSVMVAKRDIVLVGHALSNDTTYLAQLGIYPAALAPVKRSFDTQRLGPSTKKNSVGLSRLLDLLEIEPKDLHNAGNDAMYTLQALLAVAVAEHRDPGGLSKKLEETMGDAARKRLETREERKEERKEAKRKRRSENAKKQDAQGLSEAKKSVRQE